MSQRLSNYPLFSQRPQNGSQARHENVGSQSLPEPVEKYTAPIVSVFADGGVMGSSRSTVAGSWAWCHVSGSNVVLDQGSDLLFPTKTWPSITNNYAEYVAAVRCLEALPEGWIGHVYLDSAITIGRLASGWANNGLPDKLVERGLRSVRRLGGLFWHQLDGHPTKDQLRAGTGSKGHGVSLHNVWCDEECQRLLRQHEASVLSTRRKDGDYYDANDYNP